MEQPLLATQTTVSSSWSAMEHRCGVRRRTNLPVRLFLSTGGVLLGRLRDISLSGAFIQTWRELPVPSRVLVELRQVNAQGRALRQRISATVIRNAVTGVGLEWSDFAPLHVREQWHLLADDAPESSRVARRRRAVERRILLGQDWLVYHTRPQPSASLANLKTGEIPPQFVNKSHNSR